MKKRYQVFVSSTYEDLKEERFEVLKALLELDCIPCGMEYFPAASDDQWSYIRELISECDYYLVIVAGRYGSTDEEGVSYTEKEFDYAVQQGIPVIGFVHPDPSSRPARFTEATDQGRRKLATFTGKVKGRMVKYWNTPHELGGVVSRGIMHLIRRTSRTGWVRADTITDEASEEVDRLTREVERLAAEVDRLRTESSTGPATTAATDVGTSVGGEVVEFDVAAPDIALLEGSQRFSADYKGPAIPSSTTPIASDGSPAAEKAPPRKLLCKECGTLNEPQQWYCQICDSELDDSSAPEDASAAPASQAAPSPAPTPPPPTPKGESVVCNECGTINEPHSWYCEFCGNEL